MTGLILKDIKVMRQQLKIYALIMAIWIVLGFTSNDPYFFGGVMMMFTVLIPISSIAYDEKSNWNKYVLTMPVTRSNLVLSKYLLAFICAVTGGVLSAIVSFVMTKNLLESLVTSIIFLFVGIAFADFVLPAIFKFGVEKGRLVMIVSVMIPMVCSFALSYFNIPIPTESTINALVAIFPFAVIVLTVGSVFLSRGIYLKKDF